MNFTLPSTRLAIIGNALLLSLGTMSLALANWHIDVLGTACSCGMLLLASYFLLLYMLSVAYGARYRRWLWWTTGVVIGTLVLLGWLLLHFFETRKISAGGEMMWEKHFPMDIVLTWGGIGAFLGLDWRKKLDLRVTNSLGQLFWEMLCVCGIGHIVISSLGYCFSWKDQVLIAGNIYGFFVGSVLGATVLLFVQAVFRLFTVKELGKKKPLCSVYASLLFLLCGICLFTNLLVVKRVIICGQWVTVALFVYVWTFVCTDVLSELFGHQAAKWAIWSGWVTNIVLLLVVSCAGALPVHQASLAGKLVFTRTFSFVSATVLASMVAYLVAQFTDIGLFAWLFRKTNGRYLWLRNNVATIVSQGLDTFIFASMTWVIWSLFPISSARELTWDMWWQLTLNEYAWKVMLALLDTPLVYSLVYLLSKRTAPSSTRIKNC